MFWGEQITHLTAPSRPPLRKTAALQKLNAVDANNTDGQKMKALFLRAPTTIRAAALLLPATPVVMTSVWLRLYLYPKNPNAWLIIAVLGSIYAGIGFFLLKGSNVTRWIWAVFTVAGLIRFLLGPAARLLKMGSIDTFVCVSMTIVLQLTVVTLCFLPASRAHFTTEKVAEAGVQPKAASTHRIV